MTVSAIDEDHLGILLSPEFRSTWVGELPVCRLDVPEIQDAFLATGLLGPRSSVYSIAVGDADLFAQAYVAGDTHDWRTLRIGIAAGDGVSTELAGEAIRDLAAHLLRTTSILKVERLVDTTDARGAAMCAHAGLRAEGSRTEASAADGLPHQYSVFSAVRAPHSTTAGRGASAIKRIAILTGGGDAPGLNAVIRAAVKTAVGIHGWEVLGIEESFEGLLATGEPRRLTPDDVRGLLPRGGTILGTTSTGMFNWMRDDSGALIPPTHAVERALANLDRLGVDAIVAIGGDGTQSLAALFAERGFRIVGVPKTIDNDLEGTDQTFGFATAVALATDAIDRLHTTGESHHRVMVLEVMGRTTGWIALHSAISGGADVVLIPEIPFDFERVADAIRRRDRAGRKFSIVVVSEGASAAGGRGFQVAATQGGVTPKFAGAGAAVAERIAELTGKDARCVVLGHLQRGGTPTPADRLLATMFGTAAIDRLAAGESGVVVVLSGREIGTVDLTVVAGKVRRVPLSSQLIRTAIDLGIELGADLAD